MSTGNINQDPAKAKSSAEQVTLEINEKMKRAQPLTEAEAAFMLKFASGNDELTAQIKKYIAAFPAVPTGAQPASAAPPTSTTGPTSGSQGDGIEWAQAADPLTFLKDK
jgi:hypothetical protein